MYIKLAHSLRRWPMFRQHRSPDLGSALNFEETLKMGDLSRAQYILCFLALGVVVSASDKPLHGLTSFTDRLRRAFHHSPLFTIVFFFSSLSLEHWRIELGGEGGEINKRHRKSAAAIAMQQPVSSIPLLPLLPRLPTLTLRESG